MMRLAYCLVIGLAWFGVTASAFQLGCVVHAGGQICWVQDTNVTEQGMTMTSISMPVEQLTGVWIYYQHFYYMPKFLESIAPKLRGLDIQHSQLQMISKEDLKQFPKLRHLNLSRNNLQFLSHDLFEGNPKLESFIVDYNQLEFVGTEIFDSLPNLNDARFTEAGCINGLVYKTDMEKFKKKLREKCRVTI